MCQHPLSINSPSATWDDGLPLGNGLLGALVWGDGAPLNISLDRTDLWDLRPIAEWELPEYTYATMRAWHQAGRHEENITLLEKPCSRPGPTKIPAGRLVITLPGAVRSSEIDIERAVGKVHADKASVQVLVHADQPIGIARVETSLDFNIKLIIPDYAGERLDDIPDSKTPSGGLSQSALANLGYAKGHSQSGAQWQQFVQPTTSGNEYAVHVAWQKSSATTTTVIWSVALGTPDNSALKQAQRHVEEALACGWEALLKAHTQWWKQYWGQSSIRLPDQALETLWYHEQYRFASASRRGAPPISLQGPWTADHGQLPPWKGDYHHDLNTQLSYWPCYAANHLEEGLAYIEWLWAVRDEGLAWTKKFWQMPGMNIPMCTDVAGRQLGGWRQYTHSATTGAWLSHHFWLHWRYSQDRSFLRDRAWPWLRDCSEFILAVTNERNANGQRTLPLSSTPEMFGNTPEAWFPSITNHDLSLIRWLLTAAAELADEVSEANSAARFRAALTELPELARADDGRLLLAANMPLPESHRHHAHLMAMYPLGLVDRANGPSDQQTITASLNELNAFGPGQWCGYSWAWLGCLRARGGDGEGAAEAAQIFQKAFCSRSGFHLNGDQSGTKQFSTFEYRPFTLEGNFAAATAVQEMLLASHAGIIEVFPAIPQSWVNAAFSLRAEGAFMVSAERRDGRLVRLSVHSDQGGSGRIRIADGSVVGFTLSAGATKDFT